MKTYRYFTFGQNHMTNYSLPYGGKLSDYWVCVEADEEGEHRELFMELFTKVYCPHKLQFALEYDKSSFKPEYYPLGLLVHISKENGITPF